MLFDGPFTVVVTIAAVVIVGMAKGGFAGLGALATPLLALALPPAQAAALLLPILIVQDVISVWSFRRTWDRWIIAWMLPGALAGVGLGWLYAASVNERALVTALGLITFAFGAWRLWTARGGRIAAKSRSPGWIGSLFGLATEFTSQIAHAGGPPFQMWVAPRGLPHTRFVGTQAVLFATLNWVKLPAFLALGALTRPVLTTAAVLMPLAILSTLAGVWLIRRVETGWFYAFVYWVMVALGLYLAWRGLT
jgi:uncharacterized membrane protein YfcA